MNYAQTQLHQRAKKEVQSKHSSTQTSRPHQQTTCEQTRPETKSARAWSRGSNLATAAPELICGHICYLNGSQLQEAANTPLALAGKPPVGGVELPWWVCLCAWR
ncbi:hypothetical protein V5799_016765 [Amblyomma americanum]|uniref:Uncharacterized protein n=1 Tax=Amblyomma americanum TaxID=6943 RepID=A0AAQ4F599_AMBAM